MSNIDLVLRSLEQGRPELLLYAILVGLHQFATQLLLLVALPLLLLARWLRHRSAFLLLLLFLLSLLFYLLFLFLFLLILLDLHLFIEKEGASAIDDLNVIVIDAERIEENLIFPSRIRWL